MFDSLSKKLMRAFERIAARGSITEADVDEAARDIKIALLEADVSFPLVKDMLSRIKEKAVGQKVIEDVSAANQIIKIVNDELVALLGEKNEGLNLGGAKPAVILMAGLNGSGKTTTAAKLAKWLMEKDGLKVFLASADTYRPQAREQLAMLAGRIGAPSLPIIEGEKPRDIAKRAMEATKGHDVLILDTAGRVHLDRGMMEEISDLKNIARPSEALLAVDALTGQDGVNVAKAFHDAIGLTGIVMSRIDGDARGGAALSMRAATGVPIKFLGSGEKPGDLEAFHPERIASRILGMGDIVSLVEAAEEKLDEAEAKKLADRMFSGQFTLEDMLAQFQQMKKLGSMKGIMKFIPGISGFAEKLQAAGMNDETMKRQEAIILSMTQRERREPRIILMGRKRRIANGAGVPVADVERLLKQYQKTKATMEQMQRMGGMAGMMNMLKSLKDSGDIAEVPEFKQ